MFVNLCRLLREKLDLEPSPSRGGQGGDGVATGIDWTPRIDTTLKEPRATVLIPGARIRYLAEIAEQGRAINASIEKQAEAADRAQACWQALQELGDDKLPKQLDLSGNDRSEEHTSELQSLMRTPYAVFCLKKKKQKNKN